MPACEANGLPTPENQNVLHHSSATNRQHGMLRSIELQPSMSHTAVPRLRQSAATSVCEVHRGSMWRRVEEPCCADRQPSITGSRRDECGLVESEADEVVGLDVHCAATSENEAFNIFESQHIAVDPLHHLRRITL